VSVFVLLASLLFVAAGFLILATGKDAPAGLTGVVFFGSCGLFAAWELFGRRRQNRAARAFDPLPLPERQRVALRTSRGEYGVYFLGTAGFAATGALLIVTGKQPVAGWFLLLFFGPGAVLLLLRLFDRRPQLIVDVQGVFDRNLGAGWISWLDIEATWRVSVFDHELLVLELRDPDRYLSRLSRWRRMVDRWNRRRGFPRPALCLSGLTMSPDQVAQVIASHLDHARAVARGVFSDTQSP